LPKVTAARELLPGITEQDNREPIDSDTWPWSALGRVNRDDGAYCTGALVAPDIVLTAGHCVVNPATGEAYPLSSIHFVAGYRRGAYLGHARAQSIEATVQAHDRKRPRLSDLTRDWALVHLDRRLPIRPIPIERLPSFVDGANPADGRLMRAGYSRDRPHLLSVHNGCHILDRLALDGVLLTDCDSTLGDSGSPLLLAFGQQIVIVGVTSGVGATVTQSGSFIVSATAFLDRLSHSR
jgi:protease YdgD